MKALRRHTPQRHALRACSLWVICFGGSCIAVSGYAGLARSFSEAEAGAAFARCNLDAGLWKQPALLGMFECTGYPALLGKDTDASGRDTETLGSLFG